jgi:hypothetical protein
VGRCRAAETSRARRWHRNFARDSATSQVVSGRSDECKSSVVREGPNENLHDSRADVRRPARPRIARLVREEGAKNARLIAAARGETDSGERFSFAAGSPSAPWLTGVVGCPAPILGARVSGRLLDRAECGDAFERIA